MFRISSVVSLIISAIFSLSYLDKVAAQGVQTKIAATALEGNILATSNNGRLVVVHEPLNKDLVIVKERSKSQVVCQISRGKAVLIESAYFSPDDRFLVLNSNLDAYYRVNRSQNSAVLLQDEGFVYSSLFDLQRCQENTEFADLFIASSKKFSLDSKFLYLDEDRVYRKGQLSARGSWRFNLKTSSAEKYGEARNVEAKNDRPSSGVESGYQVMRDRRGRISLRERNSGKVLQVFQAQPSELVREVFLLKDGRTLVTSQQSGSIFWDLTTGKSTRKFNRIYHFAPDESRFLAFSRRGVISLNEYPSFVQKCELKTPTIGEYSAFKISNDGNFFAINEPGNLILDSFDPVLVRRGQNWSSSLFSLTSCQKVREFSAPTIGGGGFSTDSRFFEGGLCKVVDEKTCIPIEQWKFDLVEAP